MRSFYSQPVSLVPFCPLGRGASLPCSRGKWGGVRMGASSGASAGARERQGTGVEGGPDLVCSGRGAVWRVVLAGLPQSTDCWARNAADNVSATPGQPPHQAQKVPVAHSSSRGPGLSFQWKGTHSYHVRGRSMVLRVWPKVVQSFQLASASWCTAPPCPRSLCVAEGSRGPTTTSCRGRKGDSEKACDLTEVTQQIKGENERTRVHNSHLRLFPLFIAAFCVQGPRRCQNSP